MSRASQLSFWLKIRRRLLIGLFKPVLMLLFRIRITGWNHIPQGGGYLIAANHVSLLEPPLLLSFLPGIPEVVAGHDVWERPGQNILVRWYGAIPVRRGEYDRQVIQNSLAALRSGRPMLIFPEGGRSHQVGMRPAQPGVAYLVDKAQVPVLPVAVLGTSDELLKGLFRKKRATIDIRIGKPFRLPPITAKGEARREARLVNTEQVMMKIAALMPGEYHGVYAGRVAPATPPADT